MALLCWHGCWEKYPNFVSVCEACSYLLGPGDPSGMASRCGCGVQMSECPLWGNLAVDPNLRTLWRPSTRSRYAHRALWWRPEAHNDLERFLASASEFYHALA